MKKIFTHGIIKKIKKRRISWQAKQRIIQMILKSR